jgi:hypothetical protein
MYVVAGGMRLKLVADASYTFATKLGQEKKCWQSMVH